MSKNIYKNLDYFINFLPNLMYFYFSNFLVNIFSFLVIIVSARLLDTSTFGAFTVAQTIFFICYSVSFSNIYLYLYKSLSNNFANNKRDLSSCFFITLYSSLIIYFSVAIILELIEINHQTKILILILNLILISEPFSIFYSVLFVKGQFNVIFKIRLFQIFIFTLLKLLSLIYYKSVYQLAILFMLENLFFSACMIYQYKKNGNLFSKIIFDYEYTFKILKKIIMFPLLGFIFLFLMKIDIIMIGIYLGNEEAGIYSASSRLISIIMLFASSFFLFIYPNQTRISFLSNKFLKFYRSLILFSFFIGLIVFLGGIFFGKFYLEIFGENFSSSYTVLVILSFNVFFALILKLWVQKEFIQTGYFLIFLLHTFIILINIFLNIYLIPLYGSPGAAYATVLSGIIAIFIINILRINEFYLLAGAFSLSSFKIIAKEIFRIILEKKKPENNENIKE